MESLSSRPKNRMPQWPLASLLAAVCAALGAGQTQAQLYKWTDENGKTHYSDSMPPNAVDRARKEIRSDGVVKSSMDRAMTPEEKRLAAAKAAEDEKNRAAQSERERKDKALLATYPDLKDFDRVRDRTLAAMDDEIKSLSAAPAASAAPVPAPPTGATSASSGKPAAAPVSGASSGKPPAPATASAAQAAAVAEQQQRRAQAATKKRRERDEMAASYDAERVRLAALIAGDRSRITTVNVTAPRR
jgi:Domain of unknown function (DUF4124)